MIKCPHVPQNADMGLHRRKSGTKGRTVLIALGRDGRPEVVRIHDDVNARVERRGKVGCIPEKQQRYIQMVDTSMDEGKSKKWASSVGKARKSDQEIRGVERRAISRR